MGKNQSKLEGGKASKTTAPNKKAGVNKREEGSSSSSAPSKDTQEDGYDNSGIGPLRVLEGLTDTIAELHNAIRKVDSQNNIDGVWGVLMGSRADALWLSTKKHENKTNNEGESSSSKNSEESDGAAAEPKDWDVIIAPDHLLKVILSSLTHTF